MSGLETLADLALRQEQKGNERVDHYLDQVRTLLETSATWSPRHGQVFDEMIQEVRSNRSRALWASVVAGCIIVMAVAWFLFLVPHERKALAAQLTSANMPLRFEQGEDGQATAYYSTDGLAPEYLKVLRRAGLDGTPLGHYPGLGQEVPLEFRREAGGNSGASALHWAISPQQRTDQRIGSLTINQTSGSVRIQEVEFMKPVSHNDLPDLFVRVESASPATWQGEEARMGTSYELRYGVKLGGEDPVWADQTIRIRYSADGQIMDGPFLISDPRWPMAFVVAAAAGYWGNRPPPAKAYNLRSVARELRLN